MATRVLHLVSSLGANSASKQIAMLAASNDDIEHHVASLDEPQPRRRRIDLTAVWRLYRRVRRISPDVLHTWDEDAESYARLIGRGVPARRVYSARSEISRRSGFHAAIDNVLGTRRQTVACAPAVKSAIVRFRSPREDVEVIADGVAPPAAPNKPDRHEMLRELGLPSNARLIGAVGPLQQRKRLKELIWAADLLKCVRDDVFLLIIGAGPHRWRLQRYVRQVEIADRALFLGERRDVERIMPHFDCLWSAADCLAPPTAVLEAQAAGVPVVAADSPGHRACVEDASTGRLVLTGDRAAFARVTNLLLNDESISRALGENARRVVLQSNQPRETCARLGEIYRRAAA